jgi:dTDP-glucose pyrophosphorylase
LQTAPKGTKLEKMNAKVRKAVFPAAGLGTRFLPATKAQPKEMLPIVDKPIIQYGVEEAMQSGIQNIIIVTGRGKTAIEDHFDVSFELENLLESRGKKELLAIVRNISDMINVSYVRQKEALGLGHAVLRASELVGDEPFAVVLADDVIEAKTPCLRQLLDVYGFFGAPVLAVMEVPRDKHLVVRRDRRRAGVAQRNERPRIPDSQHGGETEGGRGAFEPGDYRPLRVDARDFRFAAGDRSGLGRGDSIDGRPAAPAAQTADLRGAVRGHALRCRR